MNRKVVDLTTLYNFYKGSIVFFSTDFAQYVPNFECRHVSVNRSCWQLTTFFILFYYKFEMPFYMKVVFLDKLDKFHIGRFLSV
jgi:hypothetical protein